MFKMLLLFATICLEDSGSSNCRFVLLLFSRACERSVKTAQSGPKKRVKRGAGVAENDVAELGAGGRGAGSGLNQLLTARSNLTFHSTHFITYIVCNELSAVYSFSPHSFTLHALALSLV